MYLSLLLRASFRVFRTFGLVVLSFPSISDSFEFFLNFCLESFSHSCSVSMSCKLSVVFVFVDSLL